MPANSPIGRRRFMRHLGAGTALLAGASAGFLPTFAPALQAAASSRSKSRSRPQSAYQFRKDMAQVARRRPLVEQVGNGDEERYATRIGNFSKGLPHDSHGEVDPDAYNALLQALTSRRPEDFELIPMGHDQRLVNPQAGLAFDLEGPDSHHLAMRPAPAVASAEAAGELTELYWLALARDVSFANYATDPIVAAAAVDLSGCSDFRGPKNSGQVTTSTIFRGNTPGDLVGPYLSQFLWQDIRMGAILVPQRMYTVLPDKNYLTSYPEWLAVQDGLTPAPYFVDQVPRYIRNLRDLAEWVHVDALYQAYHQAALILLWQQADVDPGNPYEDSETQIGFGTFGGPHLLSLVTEVATRALKAVWFQKWFVQRRVRPEALAGLVHHTLSQTREYPVHADVLNAAAPQAVHERYGSYLLPVGPPEGCPLHPSYGAGHATVAGACVTILKAWFDESWVLPDPVVPNADGTSLLAYDGPELTVGNELNKLAANVAIGRNALGVHYRSDYWESVQLGEQVALGILEEQHACYNEGGNFTLTKFDGTVVTI